MHTINRDESTSKDMKPQEEGTEDKTLRLEELRCKWNEKFAPIMGPAPAQLPPMREVNHLIPYINEDARFKYHQPRCPSALMPELITEIDRYVEAGWWQRATGEQAMPLICIAK